MTLRERSLKDVLLVIVLNWNWMERDSAREQYNRQPFGKSRNVVANAFLKIEFLSIRKQPG